MDIIKSVIDIVKDVCPTVQKYVKYQFCPNDYVHEFVTMQQRLERQLQDVEAALYTQLNRPGKKVGNQVDKWREEAREGTAIKVEDLICKGGCFTYICSSRKLNEKTRALNGIFIQGEKYTNAGESLVIDDHSIEYCQGVFIQKQEQLKLRQKDIEAKLETQLKQPGKIARKEVEDWMEKAGQQIAIKVEDLIGQGECSSSTNLEKKTEELKQLFEQGEKYTNAGESLVVDDHSIKGVPLLVEKCIGRENIQDQILQWLKGDKGTRIAVWGMGGVGKTTIMKQVHEQLRKEPKFNKVIWVKVSKDFDIIAQRKKKFDILKFQNRIANSLKLKLEPGDHENENKLAGLITENLRQGSNVLILDDVWQHFCLEDVGIPDLDGNNGCKLVFTTRSQEVARAMECKVIHHVKPLPPDDALELFLAKVGSEVLLNGTIKRDVEPFLKQILQKCDGVPLAIVTVAKSMRGRLHPRSWKSAVFELSKFEGIDDCLKFSYECLESQCQECFLYCALYPEDYEIPKEELIEYWIEEGLIYAEGKTREAMNCKGHQILDKLVDNCLLELVKKRYGQDCVSMHDLLRQMALDICPHFLVKAGMGLEKLPEEPEWREDLLKASLMNNNIREIPSNILSPKCPMLTTLLLSNSKISTIPEAFFEHMLGLKILDLSNNHELSRLPSFVSKLENLTTLLLQHCRSLKEVPSLSNLGGLKKLDLYGTPMEELPQGLNMLTNLKYLHLDGKLSAIPDGLLQNLSKLQHLKVNYNIPLKGEEIGRLGKLEYLGGRFSGVHDVSIFFNSGRKFLNMYGLMVGNYNSRRSYIVDRVELKSIQCYDIDICGEPNWLPSDVQRLMIDRCKDVRSLNDIPGFQDATNLQYVKIQYCASVEFAVSLSWLSVCNLEELHLDCLDNLNAVFGEVGAVAKSTSLPAGTFSSLKHITVSGCKKIKKLFSVRWLWYLQNLEIVKVTWCEQMEEIIWSDYEGGEKVTLPNLQSLELTDLPKLKSIYSGSRTVLICDSIKTINIRCCEKIERVFWSGFNPLPTLEVLILSGLKNLKSVFDEEALGLLPPQPPTIFFPLKTIDVDRCDQLKKVFSSVWLLGYFQFLKTIRVTGCSQMEELISSSAYEEEKVTLPKLQSLNLMELPQLKSIYSGSSTVLICDSIKRIRIVTCDKIESVFWSGINPLPTLKVLILSGLKNLKSVFDEEALGLLPPQPPTIFFPLKTIDVDRCDQLKKVFSSVWLLRYFQFLKTIRVTGCSQMEELISSSAYEEEKVTLPKLQSLNLMELPQLKSIYSGSSTVLICDSIKRIRIMTCDKIESVFWSGFNPLPTLKVLILSGLKNLKSVFDEEALGLLPPQPPTIFFPLKTIYVDRCDQIKKVFSSVWLLGYFQFLQDIRVTECSQMEELISSSAYEEEKVTLPKLQSLELTELPQLKNIYSGSSTVLICDSVKTIEILDCHKIESVFWSGFNPLPTLEVLILSGLKNLKSVFDEEALGLLPPQPPTIFFPLKTIDVDRCDQIKKVFSSVWLLGYFQFLQDIRVTECSQMEELISSSAYEEEKVTLPKLQSLELRNLPKLKSICSSSSTVLICDSIKGIRIVTCNKIESVFWPGFNPLPTLEVLILFGLKNLKSVFDEEALGLLPPQPPTIFFPLKKIDVDRCDQLKKVFSSVWLQGYFQFLKTIRVTRCSQMEELISSSAYEEEKVTLPKLQSLELMNLPKLKSICSSSSTVLICDSIKGIRIVTCDKIESVFWSGFNPLPTLEVLILSGLKNLKSVFDEEALGLLPPQPPTIFFPLKIIDVDRCDQLKKVFSVWLLGYFQFLQTIRVTGFSQMEELIPSSAYEEEKVTLPKLQSLELMELPQLKSICSSSSTVLICDSIERLKFVGCEKLKRIPLNFGLLDNAQSSYPPSLREIEVYPKEWWESLEWDHPNTKDILLPKIKFGEYRDYWWSSFAKKSENVEFDGTDSDAYEDEELSFEFDGTDSEENEEEELLRMG